MERVTFLALASHRLLWLRRIYRGVYASPVTLSLGFDDYKA